MPSINDLVLCYERAIFTVVPGAFSGRHKEILPLLPTKKQLLTSYQPGTLPAREPEEKRKHSKVAAKSQTAHLSPPGLFACMRAISSKEHEAGSDLSGSVAAS
jgi:hypothetical protein